MIGVQDNWSREYDSWSDGHHDNVVKQRDFDDILAVWNLILIYPRDNQHILRIGLKVLKVTFISKFGQQQTVPKGENKPCW